MDLAELMRRQRLIGLATEQIARLVPAWHPSVAILDSPLDPQSSVVGGYTVAPAEGGWNVYRDDDHAPHVCLLFDASEGDAAQFVADEIARAYRDTWVTRYPAIDKNVYLTTIAVSPSPFSPVLVAAVNPASPPGVLSQLAIHSDSRVRDCVAANESAPSDVLRALALDPWVPTLVSVARNHATPTDLVDQLSRHDHLGVRWTASGNPRLSAQRVAELASDADFAMRWHLAYGHEIDDHVLGAWAAEDAWLAELRDARGA